MILSRIRQTGARRARRTTGRDGHHRLAGFHTSGGPACAHAEPSISRSSIMFRPRSGPGGPGRARAMRHYIDHVLALLPFEPEVHASSAARPAPMSVIRWSSRSPNFVPMPRRNAAQSARHAAAARAAGQPQERDPPPDRAIRQSGRADRKDGVAARRRDPDHTASAGHGPARDGELAAAAADRGRSARIGARRFEMRARRSPSPAR